jgi:hypothetical protein
MLSKRNKRNNKKARKNRGGQRAPSHGSYTTRESSRWTFLEPHKYVTFHYAEVFTNSVLTVTGSQQIMNLNSLFDPNRTGTGHQPYGFDQIAALYNRYRVLSTRWRVTFGSQSGTYQLVVVPVNGLVNTSITDLTSYQTVCELPLSVVKTQGGGGGPTIIVERSMHLRALTGVTQTEYLADDRFESVVTSSPAELLTLYIGFYNPSASTISIPYTVEVWYTTDMHDPISVAGS